MRSKTLKNDAEASGDGMGIQDKSSHDTAAGSKMKLYQSVYPVSRIANGLSENLKNVQKHRLLMQEEINHVLGRLMFGTNVRAVPATPTGTVREEDPDGLHIMSKSLQEEP